MGAQPALGKAQDQLAVPGIQGEGSGYGHVASGPAQHHGAAQQKGEAKQLGLGGAPEGREEFAWELAPMCPHQKG